MSNQGGRKTGPKNRKNKGGSDGKGQKSELEEVNQPTSPATTPASSPAEAPISPLVFAKIQELQEQAASGSPRNREAEELAEKRRAEAARQCQVRKDSEAEEVSTQVQRLEEQVAFGSPRRKEVDEKSEQRRAEAERLCKENVVRKKSEIDTPRAEDQALKTEAEEAATRKAFQKNDEKAAGEVNKEEGASTPQLLAPEKTLIHFAELLCAGVVCLLVAHPLYWVCGKQVQTCAQISRVLTIVYVMIFAFVGYKAKKILSKTECSTKDGLLELAKETFQCLWKLTVSGVKGATATQRCVHSGLKRSLSRIPSKKTKTPKGRAQEPEEYNVGRLKSPILSKTDKSSSSKIDQDKDKGGWFCCVGR